MGKIMLNDVTYSGTIYEANDSGGGGEIKQLPASRVTYDDDNTQLGVDTAQYAIEKLKKLNDNLSEKIPFSLAYHSETDKYGYIDNKGDFISFNAGTDSNTIEIEPYAGGRSELAKIKVNGTTYSILGDTGSMMYAGTTAVLKDLVYNKLPIGNLYSLSLSKDYTYNRTFINTEGYPETEEMTLSGREGDLVICSIDGLWQLIPMPKAEIDVNYNQIDFGEYKTLIGTLELNGALNNLYVPANTAETDETLNYITFGKDEDGNYGYYKVTEIKIKGENEETTTEEISIFIPFGAGGGSTVTITDTLETGTNIATITIDGESYYIKSPSITGVKFEKANSYADLPNPGEEGTIYLVPKQEGGETNIYIEYIWVVNDEVGAYEMLGDTAVKAVDIEVSADYTEGTKIATITVDNTPTELKLPIDNEELDNESENAISNSLVTDSLDTLIGRHTSKILGWSADEEYISEDTEILCTLGGRAFRKTNDSKALVCYGKRSITYTSPLIISTDPDAVKYTTSIGGNFPYADTIEYLGFTWYLSSYEYSMQGDLTNTNGYAKKLEYTGAVINDADYKRKLAVLLLETANVKVIKEEPLQYQIDEIKDNIINIEENIVKVEEKIADTFDTVIGWHELESTEWTGNPEYINSTTDIICNLGGRKYQKSNTDIAIVAYGKCSTTTASASPIIISPTADGCRYSPSDAGAMYSIDYLGIHWYITAYNYGMGDNDMQEGYGIRVNSPANTMDEAGAKEWALAVLQAANVHLVGRRSIQTQIDNINSVKLSTEGHTDGAIRFGITEDGQYGYYKVGADTVTPFKTGGEETKGLKRNFNCSGKVVFDNNGVVMTLEPNGDNNIITVPFRPGDRSWKMETKLNLRSIFNFNTIFGVTASVHPPIVCEFNNYSQIKLWLTSPTTDYTRSLTGTHVYQTDKDIWIRIGYKDQIYFIEYSDDGINYIRDASLNDPVTIKDSEENIICIGGCYGSYQNTVRGIIYLQDTHLYIDDEIWW